MAAKSGCWGPHCWLLKGTRVTLWLWKQITPHLLCHPQPRRSSPGELGTMGSRRANHKWEVCPYRRSPATAIDSIGHRGWVTVGLYFHRVVTVRLWNPSQSFIRTRALSLDGDPLTWLRVSSSLTRLLLLTFSNNIKLLHIYRQYCGVFWNFCWCAHADTYTQMCLF